MAAADAADGCPAGHVPLGDACLQVGPPECAAALAAGEPCVPRWCWDLRTAAGDACPAAGADCLPVGRACTAAELGAGGGCPAGTWPDPTAEGACRAAGLLSSGATPQAPPPKPTTPAWCEDGPGSGRRCREGEVGCPAGTVPEGGACVPAGVDWTCPPGFLAQESPEPLPRCSADPADCGGSKWPAGPADLYVDAAAPPGGTGTQQKPLTTLTAALAKAAAGATIAVAAGTYAEKLAVAKPVRLLGRCAAQVTVAAPGPDIVTVTAASGTVRLQGLTLTGKGAGVVVKGSARVELRRLSVRDNTGLGIGLLAGEPELDAEDVYIGDVAALANGEFGDGINAIVPATLDLRRVRVAHVHRFGIALGLGGSLHARELVVDHVLPQKTEFGYGVSASYGASLVLDRALLAGNRGSGVNAIFGAQVDGRGVRIVGTVGAGSDAEDHAGLYQQESSQVRLAGSVLEANVGLQARISGEATRLDAVGLLVTDGSPEPDTLKRGWGLFAEKGAAVHLVASRITASRAVGLYLRDAGTVGSGAGLVVDGTEGTAGDGSAGIGITVTESARLVLAGARVHGNRMLGLAVTRGGVVHAAGTLVDGTRAQAADGLYGGGLFAFTGSAVSFAGSRLHGNVETGLTVADAGSRVDADGLVVDGTTPRAQDGLFGMGVSCQSGARFFGRGCLVAGNHTSGVAVDKGRAELDRCVVRDTLAASYRKPDGATVTLADGVLAFAAQRLVLDRCLLSGQPRAGALVDGGSDLAILATLSTGNLFGLVVQGGAAVATAGSAFAGNAQQDRAGDAGLTVPPSPPLVDVEL